MEHGDTERLERIGQAILAAARDELYLGMRFLDVALSSFEYQMNTGNQSVRNRRQYDLFSSEGDGWSV